MPNRITISAVLKESSRTASNVETVLAAASKLGMKPESSGLSTVSLSVSHDKFAQLFGEVPKEIPARSAVEGDLGAMAGRFTVQDLSVPDELTEHVASLSVEPPAIRYSA